MASAVYLVDHQIRPILIDIANNETQKIATSAINHALATTLQEVDMNKLILLSKNESGDIISVGYDSDVYNEIMVEAVASAQYYLRLVEEGRLNEIDSIKKENYDEGIIHYIPLGAVTNNALLSHLGPKIPVRFSAIGDVGADLNEEIKNVGINNTWVRVALDLEVQIEVIIPFGTEMDVVSTTVPVGMNLIPGEVPYFYGSGVNPIAAPAIKPEHTDR
ncbi:sporulation protein YunB [Alteribacter natronophilus]|nr:sporulation protein YunB [Alteribacter natronophilus]